MLLIACPESARETNKLGRLLIHNACDKGSSLNASIEVIAALLDAYPEGIRKKEKEKNMLPLKIACHHKAPIEMIATLLEVYPEVANEKDGRNANKDIVPESSNPNKLPLYYACEKGLSSVEDFNSLLATYLEAPRETDGYDNKLPRHISCEIGTYNEIVNLLLTSHSDGVRGKDINCTTSLRSASI